MYNLQVPYKNYKGRASTKTLTFSLNEVEVFKLSEQFGMIFGWQEQMEGVDTKDIDPKEVLPYFTAFEEVLLTAWGEISDDGEEFKKGGRYDFEESAVFIAALMMFVTDPILIKEFLEQALPDGMEDTLKKQEENMKKLDLGSAEGKTPAELQAEIDRLRTQLPPTEPPITPAEPA